MGRVLAVCLTLLGTSACFDVELQAQEWPAYGPVALTSHQNGCNFSDWPVGETSYIMIEISRGDRQALAFVEGISSRGGGLLGGRSDIFIGVADGDYVYATLNNARYGGDHNCSFGAEGILDVRIKGDSLEGELRYEAGTVADPDCVEYEGCVSRQQLSLIETALLAPPGAQRHASW